MQRPNSNIGLYFLELAKDSTMGGQVQIPKDTSLWPDSWSKVEYKNYPHAQQVKLLKLEEVKIEKSFTELVKSRKSRRDFKERTITLKEISSIFAHTCSRFENSDRRVHASGGARYPLEYYVLIKQDGEIQKGLYHYSVENHTLEFIKEVEEFDKESWFFGYDWAYDAEVTFFITGIHNRTTRKYGERGIKYMLLEAGHVSAHLYLTCTALDLKIVAIAGTNEFQTEKLLEIDGDREMFLHALVLG